LTDDALRAAYTTGEPGDRLAILHEILRLEPVVANLARWTTATVPTETGPVTIPAGVRVDVGLAVANLDPAAVGPDADRLCPGRPLPDGVSGPGLSMGDGPHRCPGAHVAIQATDIFLTRLLTVPGIRMTQAPVVRFHPGLGSYELVGLIVDVGDRR
jgi:cytochrome P450